MKKMKKRIALTLAILMMTSVVIGCSSANMSHISDKSEGSPGWEHGQDFDSPGAPEAPREKLPNAIERKFIQNGELALRSSDVDKTYESLVSLTERLDGRVVSYERQVDDDYGWIHMQVAVPFGSLSEFMDVTAEHVTRVETKTVTSEEVTESYYDTKTRLQSTEDLIEHYRGMLKKAETIEDTLLVQSRIDELTIELESLKGHLKLLDSWTQESRIDITIRLESDPTITKPEVTWKTLKWSDVGYLMKNAIQKVGIGIVLGFQYFLVVLVYLLPLIVLLVLILFIVWICRRRKRKRKARQAAPLENVSPEGYRHSEDPVQRE